MSQDGRQQPSDLGDTQALRVGSVRPDIGPIGSFETDSVETFADAFESRRRPEPFRAYPDDVFAADHHVALAVAPH